MGFSTVLYTNAVLQAALKASCDVLYALKKMTVAWHPCRIAWHPSKSVNGLSGSLNGMLSKPSITPKARPPQSSSHIGGVSLLGR